MALERSLDVRGEADADRVLIVGELSDLGVDARAGLARILALGPAHGLRVLSATTDLALAGSLASAYLTRVVYALGDDDASVRLLGSTDAANLPSDGSMLVRLGGRTELIEAYQLRVLDEDLAALLEAMRAADTPEPAEPPRQDPRDSPVGRGSDQAVLPTTATDQSRPAGPDAGADGGQAEVGDPPDAGDAPAAELDQDDTAVSPEDVPAHVGVLLVRAEPGQPVLQCLGGLALWCRDRLGRVRLVGPGTGPRACKTAAGRAAQSVAAHAPFDAPGASGDGETAQ